MKTLLPLLVASLLAACATSPAPPTSAGEALRFSGKVEAIDNGCFADGVCSVTVDGVKIVTLVGWSRDTWGQRSPELKVGDTAEAYCRKTPEGCTLNGDAAYYVRQKP